MKTTRDPPPNAIVYSTAISACARKHDARTAILLLQEMQDDEGLPPDAICYTGAMHACSKAREGGKALGLLREMEERGERLLNG